MKAALIKEKPAGCHASPTAAKRMRQVGYTRAYDYAAGKKDWKDAGLPVETGGA